MTSKICAGLGALSRIFGVKFCEQDEGAPLRRDRWYQHSEISNVYLIGWKSQPAGRSPKVHALINKQPYAKHY